MPTLGRRHFLRLTGLTATGLALPGCITKALEIPAHSCSRSLMDVEHVVILLQENRAFDHYFGTMAGVRDSARNLVNRLSLVDPDAEMPEPLPPAVPRPGVTA